MARYAIICLSVDPEHIVTVLCHQIEHDEEGNVTLWYDGQVWGHFRSPDYTYLIDDDDDDDSDDESDYEDVELPSQLPELELPPVEVPAVTISAPALNGSHLTEAQGLDESDDVPESR